MAKNDITIVILRSDPTTGKLTLSDNGHSIATPEDDVTWVIGVDSGVNEITGIVSKDPSVNIYSTRPRPDNSSGSKKWKGKIKNKNDLDIPTNPGFVIENYNISWKDSAGAVKDLIFDPQIQVNS